MTLAGPVLVVEPYFGGSHKAWAEGLREHLPFQVELLTLPPRWWKWRMRGAAVTMAEQCATLSAPPSVVVVSDMIDLPAFLTFARPHLGDAPVALYFHESQFTYPDSPQMEPDLHYAVTNWLSALAADRVFFNSNYHRSVFLDHLPRLLRHFPDHTHEHRLPEIVARSEVLEVGVDLAWARPGNQRRRSRIRLLWNHRWEHDKDPEAFFAAVDTLAADGHDFEVVVCGESFRQNPGEFVAAARRHPDRIVHMGHLPRDEYRSHLNEADVVVSTARQEFFGVAVVEAIAAGCFPVLPDRLSYPELIPRDWHDDCLYPEGGLVAHLTGVLENPEPARKTAPLLAESVSRFGWETMAPRYAEALAHLTSAFG